MIERYHLRIIHAVQHYGSVTAAADSLCITQSAVTHAIKKLEQQAGVAIWQKNGRNVRFTPAGLHIIKAAERLLPSLQRLDHELSHFANGSKCFLYMGIECYPCSNWLKRVIEPYCREWADVELDITHAHRFGGIGALLNHEVDILLTPDPVKVSGVVSYSVSKFEQVLVVSQDHALANKQLITPKDLATETLYVYPVEQSRLDIFKYFLTPANCLPKRLKTIETTDLMLQMVSIGRGVACLPDWLFEEFASVFNVVAIPLGDKGLQKELHLVIRDADVERESVMGFIDIAKGVSKVVP